MILTASDAAPSIAVVVPSRPTTLDEFLQPYLEALKENDIDTLLDTLTGRQLGADQISLPLQSRHQICVTLRKGIVEGDKVYYVHIKIEEDLALLRSNIYYP